MKMKGQQLKKSMWKPEEDMLLKRYVETYGEGKWSAVSKKLGLLRDGKSCRLRWKNYLRPDIKHGSMSKDEEDLIIRMHKLLGNRWSLIAGRLPGRTDNEVKNYWNTHLSKKTVRHIKRKAISSDVDDHENPDQKRAKIAKFEQSGSDDHDRHRSTQETTKTQVESVQEENINHNERKEENWSSFTRELLMGSDTAGNLMMSSGLMDMGMMDDGNEDAWMIHGGEDDQPWGFAWDHASYVLLDTFGSEFYYHDM